jgi:hypothetical protein
VTTNRNTYQDHTVVGTPQELATILQTNLANGRLIAATAPRPMPPGDPRMQIQIRLHTTTVAPYPDAYRVPADPWPAPVRPARTRAWVAPTVAILGGLAVIATLAVLTVLVIHAILTHLAVLIGLAVVVVVLALVLGASACPGLHCPGCRR